MQVLLCGKLLLSPFQNLFGGGGKSKPFSAASAFRVGGGICSSIPLWYVYCTHGVGSDFYASLIPPPDGRGRRGGRENPFSYIAEGGENKNTACWQGHTKVTPRKVRIKGSIYFFAKSIYSAYIFLTRHDDVYCMEGPAGLSHAHGPFHT